MVCMNKQDFERILKEMLVGLKDQMQDSNDNSQLSRGSLVTTRIREELFALAVSNLAIFSRFGT